MKKLLSVVVIGLLAAGLVMAGAQPEAKRADAPPAARRADWVASLGADGFPVVNPLRVTGNIITAGSSTVFPLSEAVALRFRDEGFKGNITIDSIGTGAGFERFAVAGESDIANASVPISDRHREAGKKIGRDPILQFQVGTDALAVCVSRGNTFLKNVTRAQLALIFSTAERWSDVDPTWPAQPIQRFIPGTDSGTFSFFVENIFRRAKEPILAARNLQLSEDDNVLVTGIAGGPFSIGFFGYAFYQENRDRLQVVSIDGIAPTDETVLGGTYPLARPLYLYTTPQIMQSKPQVAAFLAYYLGNVQTLIKRVGYFPEPAAELAAAKKQWMDAMKGHY